jgi:hypothetical protein
MNCGDLDHALLEIDEAVTAQLSPQAQEHLNDCKRCQELVRALSAQIAAESPSPATLRQIEQRIVADLRPVQPLPPARYLFAAFASIFILVVAFGVYRIGAFALAMMSPLQAAVMLGALAVSAGLLAYSLVHQMVPGSRQRIPPGLLPIGIIISLMVVMAVLFQFKHERNFWANGWSCIRAGTPIGFLAAVPFWLVLHRGTVLSPRLTGAATGLFAGLAGTTVLEIHCPNLDAWHILVSHLGVAVLGALAGLLIGFAAEIAASRSIGRRGQRSDLR